MRSAHCFTTFLFDPEEGVQGVLVDRLPLPPLPDAETRRLMPPTKRELALELFVAMMNHALSCSPTLSSRRHVVSAARMGADAQALLDELLQITFPEPMEGCYRSIPLLESAKFADDKLDFTVADDYAAHAVFVGATARRLEVAALVQPA